ncbi:hypothetical protein B0H12DRAFT_1109167 [Mycena haematopus]|nr:hypothetical protein B0H12DRAFT_1109167 [Mycena haematopus]
MMLDVVQYFFAGFVNFNREIFPVVAAGFMDTDEHIIVNFGRFAHYLWILTSTDVTPQSQRQSGSHAGNLRSDFLRPSPPRTACDDPCLTGIWGRWYYTRLKNRNRTFLHPLDHLRRVPRRGVPKAPLGRIHTCFFSLCKFAVIGHDDGIRNSRNYRGDHQHVCVHLCVESGAVACLNSKGMR